MDKRLEVEQGMMISDYSVACKTWRDWNDIENDKGMTASREQNKRRDRQVSAYNTKRQSMARGSRPPGTWNSPNKKRINTDISDIPIVHQVPNKTKNKYDIQRDL